MKTKEQIEQNIRECEENIREYEKEIKQKEKAKLFTQEKLYTLLWTVDR